MSSYVFPKFPLNNAAYMPIGHVKPSGEFSLRYSRFIKSPNFFNLFFRELRKPVSLSGIIWNFSSLLSPRIPNVISLTSKKKMVWPNTATIVAFMKGKHSPWNRSVGQFPGYPVGIKRSSPHSKSSVSQVVHSSRPLPATSCFSNLTPKSFHSIPLLADGKKVN